MAHGLQMLFAHVQQVLFKFFERGLLLYRRVRNVAKAAASDTN